MIRFYSENDFNNIKFEMNEYHLSDETKSIISEIMNKVGSPNYIRTPNFHKRGKKKEVRDPNFKTTIINNSEGIDIIFNKLRIDLNKITSKTYSTIEENILININGILNESLELQEENKRRITMVFINACSSRFICELTVKLYAKLLNKFELKQQLLDELIERMSFFRNIDWCDPNEDYDKFCEINKKNEEMRGFCLFLITLVKFDVLELEYVSNLVIKMFELFDELLNIENNKEIVQELSEQLFVIISNGFLLLKESEHWNTIESRINQITKMKNKMYKSISNKTIFKFMDLNDCINTK